MSQQPDDAVAVASPRRPSGRGRVLLMVDAGFLLKALAFHVGKDARSEVTLDFASVSDVLADVVEENVGHRPIRQVWYDAANDARPRAEHRALASIPGVQVRLGWMAIANGRPVQKAVDSLIVRDMLRTAYYRTADTVILLSGDGDLVPGAQEMVDFGISFHLWGVALEDPRVRQSRELVDVADARLALDLSDLVPFVRSKAQESPSSGSEPAQLPEPDIDKGAPEQGTAALEPIAEEDPASLSALSLLTPVKTGAPSLRQLSTPDEIAEDQLTDQIDDVSAREAGKRYGQRWLRRIEEATLERFLARNSRPMMPRRFDIDLLWYVSARGRDINQEEERREARNGFWDALEQHAVTPPSVVDRDKGDTASIAPQDESPR